MSNSFIRKLALRVPLNEVDIDVLKTATRMVERVKGGVDLVNEGDHPQYSHIILDGFACRYRILPDGGRSILAYLIPGDGCDLHASILNRMPHSISTLTPCTVAYIGYSKVKEMAAYRPNIYLALWWSILTDEAILQEMLVGVGRRSPDKQVAHFLCDVFTRLQALGLGQAPNFRLPLSQSDLADTAGLSRIHVYRVLSKLRDLNFIKVRHKGIEVLDLEKLRKFAAFDCGYLNLDNARKMTGVDDVSRLSDATRAKYEQIMEEGNRNEK
ncbi:Crp/Fnr family transcriptional regulator [Methylobacterium dankookense]|uniref:Nitrogen fixation regulation protein FixK n=1 Tax=Methylobacterium dankookense TaxID=560405 RepID=A0A564FXB6_9HYPH|nr:Crp/Fnr family transcriptional regulator [Methylobacterium dankookense]GJD54417.1 Nitrogen fixation regulation protein FixK [Methylobacterium dankookense]VUF12783.1 Nitrogen fixation regulation protein FixK [Methylobacterium dankookense]